jgi:hypothetical protein
MSSVLREVVGGSERGRGRGGTSSSRAVGEEGKGRYAEASSDMVHEGEGDGVVRASHLGS